MDCALSEWLENFIPVVFHSARTTNLTDNTTHKMVHEIKQDCKPELALDLKLLAVANFLTFSLVLVC